MSKKVFQNLTEEKMDRIKKDDFIPLDEYFIQRDGSKVVFGPMFGCLLPDLIFEIGDIYKVSGYNEYISLAYDGEKEIIIRFHDEDPKYDEKIILTLE